MQGVVRRRVFHSCSRALLKQCARRGLQSSAAKPATPLPFPAAPGLPPKPPEPAPSFPDDRIARKNKQAELLQRGRELRANPSKPSSVLQKRFWKNTHVLEVEDGFQVMLDKRPLRGGTAKTVVKIPKTKPHLATAIALEWDALVTAQQAMKDQYIPLTSLASRALDFAHDEQRNKIRSQCIDVIMRYLSTDTLLCWAPTKSLHDAAKETERSSGALRDQQERVARPIIDFMTTNIWPGVEINPILEEDSILPTPQPQVTRDIVRGWISGLPAFELAGLERAVLATKSLLVASRLVVSWSSHFTNLRQGPLTSTRFAIEEAALACDLETAWQTQQWGEVEDTHDVQREDIRRQLGSVVLLVS